jgi:hypothetical protein
MSSLSFGQINFASSRVDGADMDDDDLCVQPEKR